MRPSRGLDTWRPGAVLATFLLVGALAGCDGDPEASIEERGDPDPHELADGIVHEAADDLSYEVLERERRSGRRAALTFPVHQEYLFADVTRELVDTTPTGAGRALLVRIAADWDENGTAAVSRCFTLVVPDRVPAGPLAATPPVESDCETGERLGSSTPSP